MLGDLGGLDCSAYSRKFASIRGSIIEIEYDDEYEDDDCELKCPWIAAGGMRWAAGRTTSVTGCWKIETGTTERRAMIGPPFLRLC